MEKIFKSLFPINIPFFIEHDTLIQKSSMNLEGFFLSIFLSYLFL